MKTKNILLFCIIFFAVLGIVDSIILIDIHLSNRVGIHTQFCSIQSGCDIVDQSKYSELFGIPLGVYGLIFYVIIMVSSVLNIISFGSDFNSWFWKYKKYFLLGLAVLGIIGSVILFCIMKFLIGAFCKYCLFSELMNLLILISAIVYMFLKLPDYTKKKVQKKSKK